ncbi:MAG: 23S rRNA (guanosine(2251)-2'-O)-methyltransferase RlmB [Bacillota bacterium]|jgi:23S rRNA (guanosine2251-2'-O)-methyltransferase|nr:23S rRNA (guanosine(2251)-2'-O)-methyltransferase RlmB [Clostridia bacterium]
MAQYVAGRNSVFEVLKSGRPVNKVYLARGNMEGSIREIIAVLKERKIPIQEVEKNYLDKLTRERHQGIVVEVAPYEYVEIEDIMNRARSTGEEPLVLILAELEDPHNFGAILRTAEAVGVHGVIIPKRRSVQLNATVAKVSSGAAEYVPVARVANLGQAVEKLKDFGLWITGADMHGENILWEANLTGPLALVIGGEGRGIPKLLKEKCDFLISIPMKGKISSLNASAAASIFLFEVLRQRSKMGV